MLVTVYNREKSLGAFYYKKIYHSTNYFNKTTDRLQITISLDYAFSKKFSNMCDSLIFRFFQNHKILFLNVICIHNKYTT